MVSVNRLPAFDDDASDALPDYIAASAAALRARGASWEEVAEAVGRSADRLREAARSDPGFVAALEWARDEAVREAEAAALHALSNLLDSEQPKVACDAARIITKFVSDKRRDETRLEVQRLRAETAAARAAGKAERRTATDDLTPEERAHATAHHRAVERGRAADATRDRAAVFLWGGCHSIDDAPDATDVPLVLTYERTFDGRPVYYALDGGPAVSDPVKGPFLTPGDAA